ncbi:hypothetical protein [Psittacicella hinzii]|uniref:Uncharacterized protein n=1 Tax=Psittacicella hinzii TaxID=2028575 RepID=A0A3A1YMG2_9GAMM|nr:hypothetical protein [Psittacicella hinzii]RIY38646.1 hypothetical protein CKF58_03710 [Psittacicella hinzii]
MFVQTISFGMVSCGFMQDDNNAMKKNSSLASSSNTLSFNRTVTDSTAAISTTEVLTAELPIAPMSTTSKSATSSFQEERVEQVVETLNNFTTEELQRLTQVVKQFLWDTYEKK